MSATHRALRLLVAAFLCGPLFVAQPQDAKKETDKAERLLHLVGGERHGRSFFPKVDYPEVKPLQEGELDFRHFHTYDEVNQLLRKWARHYPDLVELYSVGKSFEGRDIWQVTLTSKKTGKDTDKPAMYIEGGRHSAEITSSESVLWLLHHLLTQYGQDPDITRLVDTKALYLRVMNNPDGAELFHKTAQTNRSNVRPHDTDRDGLLDEDPGEDLDGDGYIREMRKNVGEGKGTRSSIPGTKPAG